MIKVLKNLINKDKKVVFVGLSGGVDSSVSAALLKEQGFDVRGVFIKVWQPDFINCTWKEDRLDAMRVCAKLDIPFFTLDLEKQYKKEVVDYMIREYRIGRTPNPDVMCNKYVKFGAFFDWAMKNGADYVATGHYARLARVESKRSKVKRKTKKEFYESSEVYQLLAGKDKNKDQSYFLWTLSQKQLSKTLFPVGDIEKPEVRKLAKKFGLLTAVKKDSQGLCFIGKVDMSDFLKHFLKTKPGKVLDEKGEIIGTHDGVELYTIGQRHGFIITKSSPNDSRKFVVDKNIKSNTLVVSTSMKEEEKFASRDFIIGQVNLTLGVPPDFRKKYTARIRYRGELGVCQIKAILGVKYSIIFKKDQISPALGQSIVLYDGELCVGGGIIEKI